MKKLFLTIFSLTCFIMANAQFEMNVKIKYVYGTSAEFALKSLAHVKNNGSMMTTYTWKSKILNMTPGWTSAVCDKNLCYDTNIRTADFNLNPGDSGLMSVYMYPDSIGGSGAVEVTISTLADTNTIIDTFYFNGWTLGIREIEPSVSIDIYPNPTVDEINIISKSEAELQFVLYDVSGRAVNSFTHKNKSTLNVEALNPGIYFLQCIEKSGATITKRIEKQ